MNIIDIIKESWGWSGIQPEEILGTNEFANYLIKDINSIYWRICPEDVYCNVIANTDEDYASLLNDQEFIEDWEMKNLVDYARNKHGSLSKGQSYCLKIPGIFGGDYGGDNIGIASTKELIAFSGEMGLKIKDIPENTPIRLKVVD
jgi:hypothetical protein